MSRFVVSAMFLAFIMASAPLSEADDAMTLHPDFPVVRDFHQFAENWWITFPEQFNKRFEDREVVFWRPGFTIWASVWNNDDDKSVRERIDWFESNADASAFDEVVNADASPARYSYRLNEEREQGLVFALYGFVFKTSGHLQVAFYFDRESDLEMARSLFESIDGFGYCLATNQITKEGKKVGYMYREEPDRPGDSGWRFFSGGETQDYVDDPANTEICSVSAISNFDPTIVPLLDSPAGAAFGKRGNAFVPE